MKKLTKTASKRLNLTSEKVRSLNDAQVLTGDQLKGVAGGEPHSNNGTCHGCDCSSMMC